MSDESASCGDESQSTGFAQDYKMTDVAVRCTAYYPSRDLDSKGLDSKGLEPRDLDDASPPSGRSAKNGRHRNSTKKAVTAEIVLRSFNTWAFKREQPADLQLMSRMISESIAREEPVSFILYWGKGPRSGLGEPDIQCLDYLAALARRVQDAYRPGAAIKLIFTDTHAELNGYAPHGVREYFGEVAACAGERGFETCFLSQLTRSAEAVVPCAMHDDVLPEETLQRLSACAMKWYRGEGTAGQGALKYFQMNMIEKRAVELAFPRSIFVTFNCSELRGLFPNCLPIFYMYSLRRGVSIKPWFLPAPAVGNSKSVDLS